MLEKICRKLGRNRFLQSAIITGILTFSAPAYSKPAPCANIPGTAQIGYTKYCVNEFEEIYHVSGRRVKNKKELKRLHLHVDYPAAVNSAAESSSEEPEEDNQTLEDLMSSKHPEEDENVSPAEKKGPPPPYLQPGYVPGEEFTPSSPSRYTPPPSPTESEWSKDNDTLGWVLSIVGPLALVGALAEYLKGAETCNQPLDPYEDECDPQFSGTGKAFLVGGVASTILGFYFLVD